nr:hypothetical protein GCM10020185_86330 [Pseudomonas brassicacearum subsp. brassicacearum]
MHLSGDLATAIGGPEATSEQIEQIRMQYGLDKPLPTQYFNWLGDLLRLDLGNSFFSFRSRSTTSSPAACRSLSG